MWLELIESFKPTHQIILIDLPCHGKSRFTEASCSMAFMAESVKCVINKLAVVNPFVVGHSMGGYVGLELAKLTTINLALLHSNFWADDAAKKNDRNRVIDIVKKRKDFFIQEAIPNLFFSNILSTCEPIIYLLIDCALKIPSSEICAATRGLRDRLDNTHLLNKQNIHIIQGEYDNVIPLKKLQSELPPEQNYELIKNCGHMSVWEKKEELVDLLLQYCTT